MEMRGNTRPLITACDVAEECYKWKEEKPSWQELVDIYNDVIKSNDKLDIDNISSVEFPENESYVTIFIKGKDYTSININHLYYNKPEWFEKVTYYTDYTSTPVFHSICIGSVSKVDYHDDSYDHDVFEPLFAELIHDLHLNPDDENLTKALQKFYDNFSNNYKIYDNNEIF